MLLWFKRSDPLYQTELLQLHNLPVFSLYFLRAKLSDLWDMHQPGSDHLRLVTVP